MEAGVLPYEIVRREDFSDVTYLLEIAHPEMARAGDPARVPLVVLTDVDELDRLLYVCHLPRLEVHRSDGSVRGDEVGQLVRFAARATRAVGVAALTR
jgi:hypothetical protein